MLGILRGLILVYSIKNTLVLMKHLMFRAQSQELGLIEQLGIKACALHLYCLRFIFNSELNHLWRGAISTLEIEDLYKELLLKWS
jgi:hypothetical protein